ncbi:hypothetical protein PHYSODRAFT_489448 [Phytophthora sojae]|uniref:Uncharacterized protein n=1 Tax=Phytophthora sojae (strain P6497) TaxID=1094619 RepID=G4Z5K3_PHYSP|nr:hypothetical protein PHYSODRAFT_489448 [Phytophthora sojae]EGZ21681.1 hypothetical protein PHYSODRAFT_489448 [Phytophthora sojae]|eukprot:XP_009524398.1 hypothetical protein PHYSODRAFT_489448 [Phytophthora sojae]
MLPRVSTKVHPRSSNSTAADYACLPSPSAPPVASELPKSIGGRSERDCTRWLRNYPRLSFVLLFVLCTYVGGIFISTKLTAWALSVLGVDGELASARQVYVASSQRLKSMTECVDRSSLEYLAAAKLQFEVDSKRVQKIIDANDDVLFNQRNATMTCSAAFLSSLKEQVLISASDDANSTLSCFSDRFYEGVPETNALSSSRALVLAVRALLTTQAVTAASDSVAKQQVQFENQLVDMWKSVDSIKTSIDKTLSATNTLTSEQLSSLAPILSDKDGEGHTKQSASRLGRLSKVVSSELSDPLASTSSTSLEAIRKAGRTLHTALEFLSGLHEGLSDVMDTVDGTWQLLEKQLNATAQQAVQLQKELAYAAESTAQQINRTSSAIMTSFGQAQQEIATSFDILHQHWQDAVNKLVAQGFTPWHRLGDRLVAELTANQRQSVRPENSIQRKYILPDRTTNSSLETERARLATAARYVDPQASKSSASTDKRDEFDIDTAVLRASLVDIGAFVTQVIFYVDVGRLTLLFADLAVGLISESYSDMPMLDIRGITTADTIGSVCEVFLCKHSFWTVCYAIVANASELMRVLVRFVLLLAAASVVTAGLFMWKQDHIEHCGRAALPSNASQTVIQSITRAYFENNGNSSNSVVDPLDEIERYTTIINDSIRNDYAALELDSAAVWMNQSAALDDFGDCATTTSTLVRMLQDCSEQASSDDTSLSSQCLTSELRNSSGLVTPSKTATQLSENAPYLAPPNAFESCFPEGTTGRVAVVSKLQHDLACATEKAVYLSCASWWVLVVIFAANRFAMRMIIKAAGVYWWRFLSANRLQFTGYCREDGDIVASNTLPLAIQQHLREAKWQIIGRFVGIGFSFTCVVSVLMVVFQGMV